jgi:hypothetical protein
MSSDPKKLEHAEEFMREVVAHCIDGGSFRDFIYGRLGFDSDAYVPLYVAGGMEFTNACPVNMSKETMPHIAWAGVAKVEYVNDRRVGVSWADGLPSEEVDKWPGHEYAVGDSVLRIYLSTSDYGMMFALEAGRNYAAWMLAEERKRS